jgi:hypothetical protein
VGIKHSKVSTIQTTGDPSLVGPTDWNADHTMSGTVSFTGASTADFTGVNVLGISGVLSSPLVSPNPFSMDVDLHFKGPNPYVDVTRYGVRGLASSVSTPAVAGITGSITASQTALTVSTASCPGQTGSVCFVNGDGIIVYGAGAATSLSTPGTPTVTPSVARVGTGTGDMAAGPAGSTAYQYQIVARDKTGGLTAASTAGTTATGQASLGSQSVAFTSATCSGNIVTVTTSSAHTLAVGAQIMINVATGGNTCVGGLGTFQVSATADNTHFQYLQGVTTANGGATSFSGTATVYWMNGNHVTWTAVPNAWQYYVYGRTAGSMTLLGVTRPSSSFGTDTTFDDFGSTMMAETTLGIPGYVPTTPPGSATPQPLITTISSGAGTTSLTLAAAATTTVSNATVLFTDGPNIITAATAAQNLYWPFNAGSFVVNSFTDVTAAVGGNASWMYTGGLVLNETLTFKGSSWVGNSPNSVVGGGTGQFSFMLEPVVTTNANPGVYIGPFATTTFIDRLAFNGGQNPVFIEPGSVPSGPQFGHHVSFGTVNNATDYMGIALYMRGQYANASINGVRMGRVNIQTGPGQQGGGFTGSTFTPGFFVSDGGTLKIDALFMNNRGMLFRPDNGASLKVNFGYTQGGITPFITIGGQTAGAGGTNVDIAHLNDDTTGQPFLAYLPSSNAVAVTANIGLLETSPVPIISGPTSSWVVTGTTSGQNTNAINGSNFTDNVVQVNGVGKTGYLLGQPPAPTVAISGGGSLASGTYYYQILAVDAFPSGGGSGSTGFGTSVRSPKSTGITVNGSQGVLVSWTPIPGQTTTTICRNTSPTADALCADSGAGFRVSGNSFTDTGASMIGNVPAGGNNGLSDGFTSGGTETQAITMWPVVFANLGTPANGKFVYCPDCTIANPCASGGTGAFAKRLNSIWVCN